MSSTSASGVDRPNVAVVVLDTLRAKETVPANPSVTPTLADLAGEGTEYRRAFASAPWTLPSHGSLFTGTYPSEHGAHGDHKTLADDRPTLAGRFARAGYETVGVSNNTWISDEFGFDRGFERFHKGWQDLQSGADLGAVRRAKYRRRKLAAAARALAHGNPLTTALNLLRNELRTDDRGADRTTRWLEEWLADRDGDRPFFLFANYLEPHIEYRPPREFAERFLPGDATYEEARAVRQEPRAYDVGAYDLDEREFELLGALYRGEAAYVDDHLGRLREALAAAGEWEDTVLVVTSDHGENVGEHGLLGHQYNLYDTVLHVPLVVTGGAFDGGGSVDRLVGLPDLASTLLDAAGVGGPLGDAEGQGRSFHPDASTSSREAVFAEYVSPEPSTAVLADRFGTLPEPVERYDRSLRAIRTAEFKLVEGDDGSRELYHVAEDPGETTDLSADRPNVVRALQRRLQRWRDAVDAATPSATVEMTATTEERLSELGYLQ